MERFMAVITLNTTVHTTFMGRAVSDDKETAIGQLDEYVQRLNAIADRFQERVAHQGRARSQ
jgi:hypothetical protein